MRSLEIATQEFAIKNWMTVATWIHLIGISWTDEKKKSSFFRFAFRSGQTNISVWWLYGYLIRMFDNKTRCKWAERNRYKYFQFNQHCLVLSFQCNETWVGTINSDSITGHKRVVMDYTSTKPTFCSEYINYLTMIASEKTWREKRLSLFFISCWQWKQRIYNY